MNTRTTTLGLILVIGLTLAYVVPLQAFSVGDIVVKSRRGAPFLAEIPLTLSPQERDRGVTVTFGDRNEYRDEGLRHAKVIDRLAVTWVKGTRDIIRIASKQPVRDAAFDLVLLIHLGQVTIVKTDHVKLPEPPAPPRTVARTPPPPAPKSPKVTATVKAPPKPKASVSLPALRAWVQGLPARYGPVESGKTLFRIVVDLGVSREVVWQAVVHVWQANKRQFFGGNLHGLQSGVYLTFSSDLAKDIAAMNTREARGIVSEQWEAWQGLRRAVQGRQSAVPSRSTSVARAKGALPRAITVIGTDNRLAITYLQTNSCRGRTYL